MRRFNRRDGYGHAQGSPRSRCCEVVHERGSVRCAFDLSSSTARICAASRSSSTDLSSSTARICAASRSNSELKILLKRAPFGLALNDYVAGDGPALFTQACAMGLEGIVG